MFWVSVSYIYKALGRRRATGDVTAHKSGGGPKPKLAAYDEALRAQVAQKADITLVELQAWLANDRAVKVSVGCLWARVRHLGLTLKKVATRRRAGPPRHCASAPAMAGAASRMASAQPGLCRRNRRIDQNDAALRPMPARRAPRLAGSVGSLENHHLHRRAAAERPRRALRLRRADQRREVRAWVEQFLVPDSSPAISWCWTICRATRSQASERPSKAPKPVCCTCRPTAPISTRSSSGSPN